MPAVRWRSSWISKPRVAEWTPRSASPTPSRTPRFPVYAFVNRHAYSAGALIALAADRVYMRPGSVMGAATPIVGTGEKAPEKIVSAMRSQMRALAENRGLDPAVAEAMVDEDIEIEGVVEAGKLLTLTTSEAVGLGYAREVEDLEALLADLGLAGAVVQGMQVNWAERIVRFLSNPIVAPFLLSLGFLGLIVEIKSPGLGLAGFAGLLSLALFFGSHLILGLAGMEDLLLFGAGVVLIAVEVFVIPGFGLFGVLGGVGILGGIYMSMIGGVPTLPDFAQAGAVLSTTVLIILITSWALLRHLPQSSRLARSGVFLLDREDREEGWASAIPSAGSAGQGRGRPDGPPAFRYGSHRGGEGGCRVRVRVDRRRNRCPGRELGRVSSRGPTPPAVGVWRESEN